MIAVISHMFHLEPAVLFDPEEESSYFERLQFDLECANYIAQQQQQQHQPKSSSMGNYKVDNKEFENLRKNRKEMEKRKLI